MPRLKPRIVRTLPEMILPETPFAVLYIEAGDNFEAIDRANEWAQEHGFERARELTLGRAAFEGENYFVARCYRLVAGER